MSAPIVSPSGTNSVAGSRAFVSFVSVVAATSGLLFGFDIAVISGAIVYLRPEWNLSELGTEIATSSLLAGCIFGAMCAGLMGDGWGRRKALLLSAALFAFSAVGSAFPHALPFGHLVGVPGGFVFARLCGGFAVGAASLLAPLYIAEIAPARIRGQLVGLNQMAIVTGILLSYLANWGLTFLGSESWRWMFAVAAVPALLLLVALFFVPESPRWLMERGREREAMAVLERAAGTMEATTAIDSLRETIQLESGKLRELLQPGVRRSLVIALVLAVMQQWVGVNTLLFYGSITLNDVLGWHARTAGAPALGALALIGAVNFVATIIALNLIDRIGRKALLVFSASAMGVCWIALAILFHMPHPPAVPVVVAMFLCSGTFAVGLGPGVWVLLAEIFPTRIRGRAMAVGTVALWVACTALTMSFPTLSRLLGQAGAQLIYAGMCAFTAGFVLLAVPETRGKTLEEIERLWLAPHAR
jgi:SP family arabinose:H+ symporter-like MFS transporter